MGALHIHPSLPIFPIFPVYFYNWGRERDIEACIVRCFEECFGKNPVLHVHLTYRYVDRFRKRWGGVGPRIILLESQPTK